jgi:hypothetical protein
MTTKTIKVNGKESASSIRVSNKTREMLSSLARGQESQEQVILRLIKLANNLSSEEGTKIIEKGNVIGTKYKQKHKTIDIELKNKKYSIVCTYNDLSIIALMNNKQLQQLRTKNHDLEWELDLEIVNVKMGDKWQQPTKTNIPETKILYLICVNKILEETFDIKLYELVTEEDYLDISKWMDVYDRNNLSRDSLNTDVRDKLR